MHLKLGGQSHRNSIATIVFKMDKSVDKISPVTEEAPATPIKGQVMPDWSEEEERRAVRK